ncbi:phospholipid carrier-dependent glycosyltransferase [Nocardioides zeae]
MTSPILARARERAGRAVAPPAVTRALAGWSTRWGGWLPALGVFALALGMRLWHLGTPREFSFDETYYAKHAWSLLNLGYVRDYPDDANDRILAGDLDAWSDEPELIVHPEVGKWAIALGIRLFGMDPFGWRFSAAVAGALLVLVLCRLVRRMTGSTMLGLVAGVLMAFDGMHFVLSRLALLDIFLALFITCGVACVVNDRFWLRARLAHLVPDGTVRTRWATWGPVRRLLWRPWLLTGGVMWGLAVGTKWTALYPLAAFGVLVWVWSAGARRMFGVRRSSSARPSPTACPRSATWCWSRSRRTSSAGPAGSSTPTRRRRRSRRRSTPSSWPPPRTATTRPRPTRHAAGPRPRSPTRRGSARWCSRSGRSGTTTRTSTRSTPST